MSYRADKPFGRRKTDLSSSARENSHWRQIRRDVEEDSSGLIRRYLRLSEKIVGTEHEVKVSQEEPGEVSKDEKAPERVEHQGQKRRAA
jgi:hypothetical protein